MKIQTKPSQKTDFNKHSFKKQEENCAVNENKTRYTKINELKPGVGKEQKIGKKKE